MSKILIDLFCGAGGCSKGYKDAGFDHIIGVDLYPQQNYPYEFVQMDAFKFLETYPIDTISAIHASPPCQEYSSSRHLRNYFKNINKNYTANYQKKLIEKTREVLALTEKPYIIENVPNAPLINPLILYNSMFDLPIRRHRLFETNFPVIAPGKCQHPAGFYNVVGGKVRGYGDFASKQTYVDKNHRTRRREGSYPLKTGREAMQISWMNIEELSEAIPPAYTQWIGVQLLDYLRYKSTKSQKENKNV